MGNVGAAALRLLLWIALVAAGFQIYGASGHDDPHINFWFSHTLLEQGQFVNHNGERVQQTTSVLLVGLTALLYLILPLQLVTAGYLVDVLSALACCVLVTHLARRFCQPLVHWPALLMLASTSFMLWIYGGMGAVLAALVMLLTAWAWTEFVETPTLRPGHYAALAGITLSLMLVRPEMPLLAVAAAAALFLWHCFDSRRQARFLCIFLVTAAGAVLLFLWQKWYFNSWLPLPVLAKQTGTLAAKLQSGTIYVLLFAVVNPMVLLCFLSAPFLLWQSWRQSSVDDSPTRYWYTMALVLLVLIGVYIGFVWTAGGDWMQGGRFFVPVIPLATLLLVMLAVRVLRRPWLVRLLLLPLFPGCLFFTGGMVADQTHGVPVWAQYRLDPAHEHYGIFERYNQEHLRDLAVIDHLEDMLPKLHQQLGRPVRLLSGQAGMVFYTLAKNHYGKIRFYDFRGLVEGTFTQCSYLDDVERNPMGMGWGYEQFFTMLPELKKHCQFDPPDVIYDLDSVLNTIEPIFKRAGYTMLHQEEGFVLSNPVWVIPTNQLFVPNVIFVRNDLLPLLDDHPRRQILYNKIRLVNRAELDWFHRLTGRAGTTSN